MRVVDEGVWGLAVPVENGRGGGCKEAVHVCYCRTGLVVVVTIIPVYVREDRCWGGVHVRYTRARFICLYGLRELNVTPEEGVPAFEASWSGGPIAAG